jgi:hypothetical protein
MTIYQRLHAQEHAEHYTVVVVPKLAYGALTVPLGPRVSHLGTSGCQKCCYDHILPPGSVAVCRPRALAL